jgi:hypothetical protein
MLGFSRWRVILIIARWRSAYCSPSPASCRSGCSASCHRRCRQRSIWASIFPAAAISCWKPIRMMSPRPGSRIWKIRSAPSCGAATRRSRSAISRARAASSPSWCAIRRQVDAAVERIRPLTQGAGLTGQRDYDVAVQDSSTIVITPTKAGIDNALNQAMDVAKEVIDRRINELGTREPTIIRQGTNRIVVQVPGLQDPQAAEEPARPDRQAGVQAGRLYRRPRRNGAGHRAPIGSEILPYPTNALRRAVHRGEAAGDGVGRRADRRAAGL